MPSYEITLPWGTEDQSFIEEVTELSGCMARTETINGRH